MTDPARPNIVWIFPDQWRHDAAGYAGNAVIHTPHLDALAARGTAFRNAYCESPVCQPSRASLLTVSYPRDHGMTQNWWKGADVAGQDGEGLVGDLPAGDETFARFERLLPTGPFPPPDADNFLHRLRAVGYHTGVVGKVHAQAEPGTPGDLRAYGFDDVAEEHDKGVLMEPGIETPYTAYLAEHGLLSRWREHQREQWDVLFGRDPQGRAAVPEDLDPAHTLDAFIGRSVSDRIACYAHRDDPFFLWAGFVGPHIPFDGPHPYADLYDPADVPLGPPGPPACPDNLWGEYVRFTLDLLGADGYTADDHRLMGKHYYARISLLDDQIGRIVQAVDEAGIADDTWFVFSSDHGELLGDHGMVHKGVFYDSSVRVPTLVVPPRGEPVADRSPEGLVQGIDVPATILDVAEADTSDLRGRSLLRADTDRDRHAVFSQVGAFTMVATARHKFVVATETLEPQLLHDLRRDPDELDDVLPDPAYAGTVEELVENELQPYLAGDI